MSTNNANNIGIDIPWKLQNDSDLKKTFEEASYPPDESICFVRSAVILVNINCCDVEVVVLRRQYSYIARRGCRAGDATRHRLLN